MMIYLTFDASEFIISILFVILIVAIIFGQNWQTRKAGRQISRSLKKIENYRDYGIDLIKTQIMPFAPDAVSVHDILQFIHLMIEFEVIAPASLDPPVFDKLNYLIARKEQRFHQKIKEFLPGIDDLSLTTIRSLLKATSEIHRIFKNVRHNYQIAKKTKGSFHLLQTASEISRNLMNAIAYRSALDAFCEKNAIGDSIGPLSIKEFVKDVKSDYNGHTNEKIIKIFTLNDNFIAYEVGYKNRKCYCLRAKGPASEIGHPGPALSELLKNCETKEERISLIITVDAIQKFEGEKSGTVTQGVGIAIGGESSHSIDKFQIESIALSYSPIISMESIICKQSLKDAVSPMTEDIKLAVPKIIRLLKQVIRSQSNPGDSVAIMGIGNALGIDI